MGPKYMNKRNILIYSGITLLALLLRVYIAVMAYPPQMDSVHYVQYGVRWAQGVPGQLSTIWQEAPILVAGLAYHWGLDPVRALQASTVVYGVMIVWMTMLLASRLFARPAIGWLAGLWAAASPGLVNYSVNCSAEGGFAMLLLMAYALMAPALRGEMIRTAHLMIAYGLIGLGIYFKPLDTLVAAFVMTLWLGLVHLRCWRGLVVKFVAGLLVWVAVMAPHFYLQTGGGDLGEIPLVNRGGNITLGERAYQSKYVDAAEGYAVEDRKELEAIGLPAWLWKYRTEIARRYVSNGLIALRHFGDFMLPNAFRVGNALFITLLLLCVGRGMVTGYWRQFGFLTLAGFVFTAGVSISYVYNRWLIIYVPFLIIIITAHLVLTASLWNAAWKKALCLLLLLGMMKNAYSLTVQHHEHEAWMWENQRTMALWLREHSDVEEKVMSGRPTFTLEMDLDHPDRWVRMPSAELERMELFAAKKDATYVVLSSTYYPHWPVNQLLVGATPPPNWSLFEERTFERVHPVWGEQRDHYMIFKRLVAEPAASTLPTSANP